MSELRCEHHISRYILLIFQLIGNTRQLLLSDSVYCTRACSNRPRKEVPEESYRGKPRLQHRAGQGTGVSSGGEECGQPGRRPKVLEMAMGISRMGTLVLGCVSFLSRHPTHSHVCTIVNDTPHVKWHLLCGPGRIQLHLWGPGVTLQGPICPRHHLLCLEVNTSLFSSNHLNAGSLWCKLLTLSSPSFLPLLCL